MSNDPVALQGRWDSGVYVLTQGVVGPLLCESVLGADAKPVAAKADVKSLRTSRMEGGSCGRRGGWLPVSAPGH